LRGVARLMARPDLAGNRRRRRLSILF
jgi:hypothetical protein